MSDTRSAAHETGLIGGAPRRDAVWMAELVDTSVTVMIARFNWRESVNRRIN